MKYGIILITILIGLSACRSSKQNHKQLDISAEVKTENISIRKDSTRTETSYQDTTTKAVDTVEYSRTTTYRDDGGISSIQEQWRRTGSTELSVSSGRTSEVSVAAAVDSTNTKINAEITAVEDTSSKTDSRPVQEEEFLWIIIPVCLLILTLIILFFKYYIPKKKN